MKILIAIEITSIGGHVLSAFSTAQALRKRGHEVFFAGGSGPMEETIKAKFSFYRLDYFYFHGRRQTHFSWRSFKTLKQLSDVLSEGDFDHIHAFDARSYILASMLGIMRGIPVTCTLCGGITPYYNVPTTGKLIVFSKEQREKLINVFGWIEKNIKVISARLDMTQFSRINEDDLESIFTKYGISPKNRNIMMITNFLGPKVKAIRQVLEAIPGVLREFNDVNLIMIGERGPFYSEARRIGERINRELGRQGVVFTGGILNAQRLLKAAYIVLGVGRSAFEGMAHQKPTLIVGEKGYAGTVSEENIEDIWHFNFSGRSNRNQVSQEKLTQELLRLLRDRKYYDNVRFMGVRFLRDHIDIESGISRIEKVYEANKEYTSRANRGSRLWDMGRVLFPILMDNYYNSFKYAIVSLFDRNRRIPGNGQTSG